MEFNEVKSTILHKLYDYYFNGESYKPQTVQTC